MVNSITTGIIQNPYNSYTNGYSGTIGTDTDVENQNGFKRGGNDIVLRLCLGLPQRIQKCLVVGEDEDGKKECQTCKNRKYKDGSDEANVSFKSAAHVSPQAAGAAVRAHEGEHVQNAYNDAAKNNGKVISASVSIHMSVCPECGRSYISGGDTRTQIKYYNESNPYQQDLKTTDGIKLRGANVDKEI